MIHASAPYSPLIDSSAFEPPRGDRHASSADPQPLYRCVDLETDDRAILDQRWSRDGTAVSVCTSGQDITWAGLANGSSPKSVSRRNLKDAPWHQAKYSPEGDFLAGGRDTLWCHNRHNGGWQLVIRELQELNGLQWDDHGDLTYCAERGAGRLTPNESSLPLVSMSPVTTLCSSPNGLWMALIFAPRIWSELPRIYQQQSSGQWLFTPWEWGDSRATVVDCSPDNNKMAVGEWSGTVSVARLWQIPLLDVMKCCPPHPASVNAVRWAPNSQLLATGSEDGLVTVWRLAEPQGWHWDMSSLGVMKAHTKSVRVLAWSHDSSTLATGSDDATIRVWNVSERGVTCRSVLQTGEGAITSVVFAPHTAGRFLAATQNGPVRIWEETSVDTRAWGFFAGWAHQVARLLCGGCNA